MREIGRLLGLGTTPDLPAPLVTDNLGTGNWQITPGIPQTSVFTDGFSPQQSYASLDDNVVFGLTAERIFPGDAAILHGQHLYRPEAIDIDLYRFELPTPGLFTAETIAERLNDSSLLDTTLTLYSGFGELLARNDDYFSEDSFMEMNLDSGTYFIGVAASGNVDFDPIIENTGLGGTSQGRYDLRIDFRPAVQNSMIDQTGVPLDGDADGRPGGVFNFWFQPNRPESTVYVDKSAPAGGSGSLASPFNNLRNGLTAAEPGEIVRIVGNGGADGNLSTLSDNRAYEIGFSNFGTLADGPSLEVPEGVTVMIDAGAIFKVLSPTSTWAARPSPSIAAVPPFRSSARRMLM